MIEFNILIATYNSEATLRRCLESVRDVSAAVTCNVVLIDGASTDTTLGIADEFSDILNVVVSEPDSGVYEAWNKGLNYCIHPWVMFLGSDDYLCPAEFVEYLSFVESQPGADFVSCRVKYVDDDGRVTRIVGKPWKWRSFKVYMCAAHPGSFTSMDYICRVGKFDESLMICGDYELLLRAGDTLKAAYWEGTPVCQQAGGLSDSVEVLNETLAVKLRMGHRGKILCIVDHVVAVAKYLVRSYVLRSR